MMVDVHGDAEVGDAIIRRCLCEVTDEVESNCSGDRTSISRRSCPFRMMQGFSKSN
jgi:hypothetical protein